MKELDLSVIVLVHQDNGIINKTLASVAFAKEIIVIDNNSSIDWKKISEVYPVKVIEQTEPITDFSAVRNMALEKAVHEWVFFIDSDEVLESGSLPQVAALLASDAAGAVITRSDVFHGKTLQYGEAGNQQIIRLGKKSRMRFEGKVHEVAQIHGQLSYTSLKLNHYAHNNVKEFVADVSEYARLAAATKTSGFKQNLFEMCSFPVAKLLYGLIIQAGIIDGWAGICYAYCMSLHSLLVRIYRYETLAKAESGS